LILNHYICIVTTSKTRMEDINRLKIVLVEKKKTSKWLSEQLEVNPSTVSKWCTNVSQPDIETFFKIANLLGVTLQELLTGRYQSYLTLKE